MTAITPLPQPMIPRLVLPLALKVGECPLWSPIEACLYFVDITGMKIHRYHPATGQHRCWSTPEEPGCLAWIAPGQLMVAFRSGFARFDVLSATCDRWVKVDHDVRYFRFNDGRTDAAGRFWAGTMFEPRSDALAALYCLERGQCRLVLGPANNAGAKVSNGLAFDHVNGWLYRSDTPNHVVFRHPFELESGHVGAASRFATMTANPTAADYGGRPDGAAIDSESCYWSAQYGGGRILRFASDGRVVGELTLPVKRPTMVAFGGDDLHTLYVTTARDGASTDELDAHPLSGAVFAFDLPIAGLAETAYRP